MFNHYMHFCRFNYLQLIPLNQDVLCLYASFLATHVSYKTIKAYLSAISHHCILQNFQADISSMQKLHELMRGIRRHQLNHSLQPNPKTSIMTSLTNLEKGLLSLFATFLHFQAHIQ